MTDLLSPLPSATEVDLQIQHAIADSARDLSADERYVLRRLASVVARVPHTAPHADVFVTLPVSDFALHAGLTAKVAARRLDIATHSIFERSIQLHRPDGTERTFRWAEARFAGEDSFDLSFAGVFVQYLTLVLQPIPADEVVASVALAQGGTASAVLYHGLTPPCGLPVVLTSRLKSRTKRPKGMSMQRLLKRLRKRLKGSPEGVDWYNAAEIVVEDSPWRNKVDPKYYKYTHRDLNMVHEWVVRKIGGN